MPQSYPLARPKRDNAVPFLGIFVSPVKSSADVHAFIEEVIGGGKKALLFNLNIHAMAISFRLRWYRNFIRLAHLIFCDGDGVRWGLKIMGKTPPPKMATTRWIWELSEFCAGKGFRLFLLGGKPGVADAAAAKLQARYPGLQIAGTQHGYFKHEGPENDAVRARINAARADILLVCMGMPVQERWILKNIRQLNVHIFAKGGAVLDYVTGKLGKVPEWMLKLHLEWAFRIWQEPRRLLGRYLHDIPLFFLAVFFELFKQRFILRRSRKERSGSS